MKFNENLKYLRKKEGLTQEELAEKLNVSRQSVTKWENGQALPDIEKVKEIAYFFSTSVDSLIGEIESKTENKIKKRIDDIGYFIFAYVVLAWMAIGSIHITVNKIFADENITIGITVLSVIIAFSLFIIQIKMYLRNTNEIILNMKDTEEGRRERRQYLLKKHLFMFVECTIFGIIIDLGSITSGEETLLNSIILNILIFGFVDMILAVSEYKGLEKNVKELNK